LNSEKAVVRLRCRTKSEISDEKAAFARFADADAQSDKEQLRVATRQTAKTRQAAPE